MSKSQDDDLRTVLQFQTFLLNTEEQMKACLKLLAPDENILYIISTGLMTRAIKLYRGVVRNRFERDSMSADILTRSFYETAISLEYMLVHFTKENFEEFVLTDAVRRRDLINFYETDPIALKRLSETSRKAVISHLVKTISDDGLVIANLPDAKQRSSSWHRKLSYKSMAAKLGESSEEMFLMLYGAGSLIVHPSWTDVKQNHVRQISAGNKNYEPNLDIPPSSQASGAVLVCTGLELSRIYSARFAKDKGVMSADIQTMHDNFHKTFPVMHK